MLDTVIVWLHRDLRLHDNPALTTALAVGKTVIVAYLWCPKEEGQFQPGRVSRWWLYQSLKRLDAQLQEKGNRICYRKGDSFAEELLKLCKETRCHCVLFNNVYDPISIVRDHTVKEELKAARIYSKSFNAELLYEPWEIVAETGQPYTSFESFWNAVCNDAPYEVPPAKCIEPLCIPAYTTSDIYGTTLQDLNLESPEELQCNVHLSYRWSPGTAGALRLFANFLEKGLPLFDKDRAKTDRESTSKLSPHIHFGEISVRMIYHEVVARQAMIKAANASSTAVEDFLRQLGYHDYSRYLSFHFPFTHERALLEHVRAVPWVYCSMRFKAWRQGNTGYPIVDAAMRELWATGWMHNRSRVFTASFLVKNLLQPWQWGLKHFWDMLLDADLECDALGWQYVSGCLRDAHPFNYMLDIQSESRRFDPTGNYVRKWVPQLSKMPLEWIHMPWLAPKSVLHAAGVTLGEDYPHPIISVDESRAAVDHAWGIIQKCKVPPLRNLEDAPYSAPTCSTSMLLLEPEEELDSARGVVKGAPVIRHKTAFQVAVPQHMEGGVAVTGYGPDVFLPDISKLVDNATAAGAAVSGTSSLGSSGPDLLIIARQRVGSSSGSAYAPCDRGRESASEVHPHAAASAVVDDSRDDSREDGDEAVSTARRRHRVKRASPSQQPGELPRQPGSAFTPHSMSTRSEVSLQPISEAPASHTSLGIEEKWRGHAKDATKIGSAIPSGCTSSDADASDRLASEDAVLCDGGERKARGLVHGPFQGSISAGQDSSSERHYLRDSDRAME